MFLGGYSFCGKSRSFPRASGDVPDATNAIKQHCRFSPRERGCSPAAARLTRMAEVFPARAGMFRARDWWPSSSRSFPRASGDVPSAGDIDVIMAAFSPRERGCSDLRAGVSDIQAVFPARAGMFPAPRKSHHWTRGFPRASGDVPSEPLIRRLEPWFSPRERGCS